MASTSGAEWIYVVLNILKCTLTQTVQTVSVFLYGVSGALVQTWQLAISPLLTAAANTSLSIIDQYVTSDSYSDWITVSYVVTIELLSGGVKFVHGLLIVSWYLSLKALHTAFWLALAILKTSFATLNNLLYHATVSVVNLTFMCARAVAAHAAPFIVGLKVVPHLMYQLLLMLVKLSRFSGSQISSIAWDLTLTISTAATDALFAIYQATYTLIRLTHLTSVAFMKDTVQLTYRLFLCLLYVVLPQLWQLFSEFVWMVVALIQEHRYLVGIPLLVLVVVFVTLWLKIVADSARRRNNTTSTAVDCSMCTTPSCTRLKCERPTGDGYYDYCSITCRDDYWRRCSMLRRGTPTILLVRPVEASVIEGKFQATWAPEKGRCPKIKFIFAIHNRKLEESWMSYRQSLRINSVEEHYHGTNMSCDIATNQSLCQNPICGVCGIARNGFKKHCIQKRSSKFQRFGEGFYLAPNSSKSYDYPVDFGRTRHDSKAMLVCHVCPGTKFYCSDNSTSLRRPPEGFDSVYGQKGHRLNYEEIVLYEEASILPRYIIVYE